MLVTIGTWIYIIGAVAMLVAIMWQMSKPEWAAGEVLGMSSRRYSAAGNFVGNLFVVVVGPALWPLALAIILWQNFKDGK